MALLLLTENEVEEMAYPAAFSMDVFKSLNSFQKRIEYCKSKLGDSLGTGSSRKVFPIDNEKVLKLAINKKGVAQNEAECDWFLQRLGLCAKVYDVDEEYRWIEMQKARKAKKSDFYHFTGYPFEFMQSYIQYVYSLYGRSKFAKLRYKGYDEEIKYLVNSDYYYDSLFSSIYEYMANFGLEAYGDLLRLSSWGVVSENGEESLVLIDYGLNDTVAKEFYHFKDLEEIIKNTVKKYIG